MDRPALDLGELRHQVPNVSGLGVEAARLADRVEDVVRTGREAAGLGE